MSSRDRWRHMIERCTDPSDPAWPNYGGRGITVCDEWLASFEAYLADTGDAPAPGMTLDRIDNDGNYEPGNVRWATRTQQNHNRRNAPVSRTHCAKGHPYDESNTRPRADKPGRQCKACNAEVKARWFTCHCGRLVQNAHKARHSRSRRHQEAS